MNNMNSELVKGKPLSKQETKTLLKLIEGSKVIVTKGTNAQLNKLKNAAWKKLTRVFNTTIATTPRTPQQLRLKWENLKKNSRKRSARIIMNRLQNGTPEYIPPDDILDRVSRLLASQHRGIRFDDPLEDYKKPEPHVEDGSNDSHNSNTPDDESSIQFPDGRVISLDNMSHGNESLDNMTHVNEESECTNKILIVECTVPEDEEQSPNKTAEALAFDTPRKVNKKVMTDPQSSQSTIKRNQAIAEYFVAKKQCLEAKMQNVILKNENLRSENEMLKLQNIKLKLEIEKLKT